jgi:hypothetical protein
VTTGRRSSRMDAGVIWPLADCRLSSDVHENGCALMDASRVEASSCGPLRV